MSAKKIAKLSTLTAIAVIAGIIEGFFPPLLAFAPGVKLGLGNAVILLLLITSGIGEAAVVLTVKCLLVAVFSANPTSLLYSVPAGAISMLVSYVLIKFALARLSVISVSCISAIVHNAVQLTVASITVKTSLMAVLPLSIAASVIAGYCVGIIVWLTVKKLPEKYLVIE